MFSMDLPDTEEFTLSLQAGDCDDGVHILHRSTGKLFYIANFLTDFTVYGYANPSQLDNVRYFDADEYRNDFEFFLQEYMKGNVG